MERERRRWGERDMRKVVGVREEGARGRDDGGQ